MRLEYHLQSVKEIIYEQDMTLDTNKNISTCLVIINIAKIMDNKGQGRISSPKDQQKDFVSDVGI